MANRSLGERLGWILRIHSEIAKGSFPNATSLSKTLGISVKSTKKYISYLQEHMDGEPTFDFRLNGYRYSGEVSPNFTPRLNEREVLAYFLLEETAKSLAGTPVQEYLSSALQKFSVMLPTGGSLTLPDLMNSISLRLEHAPAVSTQPIVLMQICQAIAARRCLEIEYAGHTRMAVTHRRIDPLHLTRCEGQWYLVAYCHLRNENRTFVPARISRIDELKECFVLPKDFDAAEHFKKAFGIVVKESVERVSLVFSSNVAQFIAERNWHPTQSIEKLSRGKIRLTLTCSHSHELIQWLLSWGPSVEIENPVRLAKKIFKIHKSAMCKFQTHNGKRSGTVSSRCVLMTTP